MIAKETKDTDGGPSRERLHLYPPKILGFAGPSGSGKDVALQILQSDANRLQLGFYLNFDPGESINVRVVPKITTRPARVKEVSKIPVTPEEFDKYLAQNELVGVYTLFSNGQRYAYRKADFERQGNEDLLLAEPSILHFRELKRVYGDRIHLTFLAARRDYREKLLHLRQSEQESEIIKRLNEGDGQTLLALVMMKKEDNYIAEFISQEIFSLYQGLNQAGAEGFQQAQEQLNLLIGQDLTHMLIESLSNIGNPIDTLLDIDQEMVGIPIDQMLALDDSYFSDHPFTEGRLFNAVIQEAVRLFYSSRFSREYRVSGEQLIAGMLIPDIARTDKFLVGRLYYNAVAQAILNNNKTRELTQEVLDAEELSPLTVLWENSEQEEGRMIGLTVRNQNTEEYYNFKAKVRPGSNIASLEFDIKLTPALDPMAYFRLSKFMVRAQELCQLVGIQEFIYPEHFNRVNEDDEITGIITREKAHRNYEIHRAVTVFITNDKGEIFMIKRSATKKENPGVWQAAPSGHLLPEETYEAAARREAAEEVGKAVALKIVNLKSAFPIRVYSDRATHPYPQRENFYLFTAQVDADTAKLVETNHEAEEYEWMSVAKIRQMIREDPSQFRDAFVVMFARLYGLEG
jgi:isopentenyl-diphosphate delta-isomerase